MTLREKIIKTLTKEETVRKAVSITLDSELIDRVDKVAKGFTRLSDKTFSRNSIIEAAIKEYIEESEAILSDKRMDIEKLEEENAVLTDDFDTAIFPAHNDGFEEAFLGENCWYSVRIKESRIPKIKYVAVYRAAPVSGITHYAKVKGIKQYENTGKWIIFFEGSAISLQNTIQLGSTDANAMRSPRYTTLSKLLVANVVADLF